MKEPAQLINRYRWYEIVGIYCGIAVFLTFVLSPFVEGFLVSLKPLSQLFSSPYRFIPENGSFEAYRTMWVSVPGFARYIFNSFFISSIVTAVVLCMVVPPLMRSPASSSRAAARCLRPSSPSTCSQVPCC